MNLPNVIADLTNAQNNFDSVAYANCFSETAIVFDEGQNHKGKKEIQQWIKKANEAYQAVMKPLEYASTDEILKAEVSGNFPGSPIVLAYHFKLKDGLIEYLKITG
ncbi:MULTISPECIES: nuclear transport factor 2 family protein [unclassified Arcicella]|uniref:nuclear transport factor 2 family protein n=1 Tax=unclassified Arcicella TaxID=2644986 RepID=UPI00285C1756|nr:MULTISPECIES: nuclear transport factor 2 family protein [unclassified Arcicella]MDR6562401.1 ketosteroid isomerase-like protein [Arcicella sp. BE51]MDR6812295.1 ketosteroid isomerase-like protein [Arcicella sp. BE140]MDR6823626.1 ketosteroid isomerase-like protein [Arcicella sp. BE139]